MILPPHIRIINYNTINYNLFSTATHVTASIKKALVSVVCMSICSSLSAHTDDNVFIAEGTETWTLVAPDGNKSAYVKNSITHFYEATRYAQDISPATFYNNRIKLDKASGGTRNDESASSRNVFHDDNRVCFVNVYLDKVGKRKKVQFERTMTDPAFFSRIYLADDFPIKQKEVIINIPAEYSHMTVEELNFTSADNSPISRSIKENADGCRTYVYKLTNVEGTMQPEKEFRSANPMLYQPVLLIKGWFPTLESLCEWHTDMASVDTDIAGIDKFLTEQVYAGEANNMTPRQRLEKIYSWVQHNIRYIAYEEGESGHRPDTPSEVIRKRYGDCKGMALLLATLLNHEGICARTIVIGTDDIPVNISQCQSLSATNHSICIAVENGDTLFLDATNEFIPATHIPASIQGKDAIALPTSTDNRCRIINVPKLPPNETALDSVCYHYRFTAGLDTLVGKTTRTLKGDFKEIYLSHYKAAGNKLTDETIALDLVPSKLSGIDHRNLKKNFNTPDGSATIEAIIANSEAITDASPFVYVDLNANNGISIDRIDNHDRRSPYRFPSRGRIVRLSRLELPPGATISYLPENFIATLPQATLRCTFSSPEPGIVELHKVLDITAPMIWPNEIEQWNKKFSAWDNACKSQIEITFKQPK